jgi:hypothetical protein
MSQIYRALGVRSAIQPSYRVDQFSPVAIVADMSRSFAPEAIEGRRVWTTTLHNPGTDPGGLGLSSCDFELTSRGSGGVLIEYCELLDQLGAASVITLKTATVPWGGASGFGGSWSDVSGMTIGGIPTQSTFQQWRDVNVPIGAGDAIAISGSAMWLPTDRFYLPAGSHLRMQASVSPAAALAVTVFMILREVPEAPGAP